MGGVLRKGAWMSPGQRSKRKGMPISDQTTRGHWRARSSTEGKAEKRFRETDPLQTKITGYLGEGASCARKRRCRRGKERREPKHSKYVDPLAKVNYSSCARCSARRVLQRESRCHSEDWAPRESGVYTKDASTAGQSAVQLSKIGLWAGSEKSGRESINRGVRDRGPRCRTGRGHGFSRERLRNSLRHVLRGTVRTQVLRRTEDNDGAEKGQQKKKKKQENSGGSLRHYF